MHLCVRSPEGASPLPAVSVLPVIGAESSLLTRLETEGDLSQEICGLQVRKLRPRKGLAQHHSVKGTVLCLCPCKGGLQKHQEHPTHPHPLTPESWTLLEGTSHTRGW